MKIERIEMGILKREAVAAVRMPRAQFMEIVDKTLEGYSYSVATKVRPVAQTMTTFPLGSWIHYTRGCGCVVGEYLVAADLIQRRECPNTSSISALLASDPDGDELVQFGMKIDDVLAGYVIDNVEAGSVVTAVYIED